MIYGLYNTAHPLAESGKPIFIPFGEWPYDKTTRQRLDREHGEAIANELNERVARGEPGIPVYQGHPDVPALAAKYPDKGALGWVTSIALANENGKDGLALTVEWDRDPGKGFKWFSPYWFANEKDRDGQTYIVANIRSIGLVNNPNIPEFRLANEAGEDLTQRGGGAEVAAFKLPDHLTALAKRFDDRVALANVIDANGMGHSDENGQFDGSGSGGAGGGGSSQSARLDRMLGEARNGIAKAKEKVAASKARQSAAGKERAELESRLSEIRKKRTELKDFNDKMEARLKGGGATRPRDEKGPRASINGDSKYAATIMRQIAQGGHINGRYSPTAANKALDMIREDRAARRAGYTGVGGDAKSDAEARKSVHLAAICMGLKYNYKTHKYE